MEKDHGNSARGRRAVRYHASRTDLFCLERRAFAQRRGRPSVALSARCKGEQMDFTEVMELNDEGLSVTASIGAGSASACCGGM